MLSLFKKDKSLCMANAYCKELGIDLSFVPQVIRLSIAETSASIGDTVKIGDKIGKLRGKDVCSGISGRITEISPLDNGVQSVTVENDFLSQKSEDTVPFGIRSGKKITEITADDLLSEIERAGVSTRLGSISGEHRTLSERISAANGVAKQIVINCAPCDAYDAAFDLAVSEYASDIISGMKIIMASLGIGEGVLVLDTDGYERAEALSEFIKDTDNIRVLLADLKYPCNNEHLIIHALTSIEISAHKNAERVACAVFDAREVLSIARSFLYGEKETGALVTVSLEFCDPVNAHIPYGTELSEVMSYCNRDSSVNYVNIVGGLLCGKTVSDTDTFDVTMSPIVALQDEALPVFDGERCKRCSACVQACPMMLLPNYLWEAGNLRQAKRFDLDACILCGACQYVCPAALPITDKIRSFKAKGGEIK